MWKKNHHEEHEKTFKNKNSSCSLPRSFVVTVHSPCRIEPLTLTLGFGVLRRPTSSIHGVVSLRERGFEEGGLNGNLL
jgi:hypothetical protein